jgi:hypothetical protein
MNTTKTSATKSTYFQYSTVNASEMNAKTSVKAFNDGTSSFDKLRIKDRLYGKEAFLCHKDNSYTDSTTPNKGMRSPNRENPRESHGMICKK